MHWLWVAGGNSTMTAALDAVAFCFPVFKGKAVHALSLQLLHQVKRKQTSKVLYPTMTVPPLLKRAAQND